MKTHFLITALAVATHLTAQNIYDPMMLVTSEPVGTARFVGMGGAMSALGTDITVASTNPAGIGLYRANDFVVSAGLNTMKNEATFGGTSIKSDKNSFAIDNLGLVLSSESGLGSINFINVAANYRHSNNFVNNFEVAGSLINNGNHFSQQYQLFKFYENDGFYANYRGWEDYADFGYPWLGLLTSTSGLLGDDDKLFYVPDNPANTDNLYPTMMEYYSEEKGGVDEVDISVSCNIEDRVYLGLSVGASYVDYTRSTEYSEFDEMNNNYYTLQNNYNVSGTGINLKLGAIFRPFEFSPLKLGIAVHTPTWYSLTDRTSATMIGADGYIYDTRDYDCYGGELCIDYDYTTPWRLNLSASYTFDKFVAVDAEYELVNYSTAKLSYTDGGDMKIFNEEIDANMEAQHIFRIGALFNIDDNFSLCCGYNHITAPFKKDAVKAVMQYTDTQTAFINKYETNIITLGAGYRGDNLYLDMAYKLAMQKADFYNYYDSEFYNPAASLSTNRGSFVFSVGYRF